MFKFLYFLLNYNFANYSGEAKYFGVHKIALYFIRPI